VEGTEMVVYNANGMMVLNGLISGGKKEINISSLSSGVYFVRLSYGNDTRMEKLVIN
jgi:hypothetical protein